MFMEPLCGAGVFGGPCGEQSRWGPCLGDCILDGANGWFAGPHIGHPLMVEGPPKKINKDDRVESVCGASLRLSGQDRLCLGWSQPQKELERELPWIRE